jgi:formate dehydrogenase subunit delta
MINQIAEFFVAYPEAEAVDGVTEHLEKFWDPAMRTQMVHERRACADRLHPLASKALDALADGEA